MEQTQEKIHNDLVTVTGGVDMKITRKDGSEETVRVRQIPLSKLQEFSMAVGFGNMADAIDLYCDKPKGWGDTLSYESVKALLDKGCELNLPFFGVWLKDQRKWRAAFGIVLNGAEEQSQKGALPSENSPRLSPTTTNLVPNR